MVLGILGGGVYSMLICKAAKNKSITTIVLDENSDCCAKDACDTLIVGSVSDNKLIDNLLEECDYITYENNSIDLDALLNKNHSKIIPSINTYTLSCNNYMSKLSARDAGFTLPRFYEIRDKNDLDYYLKKINAKAILTKYHNQKDKEKRLIIEKDCDDLSKAYDFIDTSCVLQEYIDSDNVITIVGARTHANKFAYHSTNINVYKNDRLFRSMLVSNTNLSEHLEKFMNINNLYGLISVELFVKDGIYYFNRMIPGIHTSGLSTIDGSSINQFEYLINCIFSFNLITI